MTHSYRKPEFRNGKIIMRGSNVRNRYDSRMPHDGYKGGDGIMFYLPKSGVFTGMEPFDSRYETIRK